MAREVLPLNFKGTIAAGLTSGATTCTFATTSGAPVVGTFRILVDSEIILATYASGSTLTLSRGAEGTTAAGHATNCEFAAGLTPAGLGNAVPTALCGQDATVVGPFTPTTSYTSTGATKAITEAGTYLIAFDFYISIGSDGTNDRSVSFQVHDGSGYVGHADWTAVTTRNSVLVGYRVLFLQVLSFTGPKTLALHGKYTQSAGSGSSSVYVTNVVSAKLSN